MRAPGAAGAEAWALETGKPPINSAGATTPALTEPPMRRARLVCGGGPRNPAVDDERGGRERGERPDREHRDLPRPAQPAAEGDRVVERVQRDAGPQRPGLPSHDAQHEAEER